MTPSNLRVIRLLTLICFVGLGAFYVGTRFVVVRPAAPVHPISGRQIAGIATDASWLDRATREQEEAPEEALRLIGITPGMVVADVGAGTGYMTTRLARIVGPAGKVYANDIQPAMLDIVRNKAASEGLSNIEVVPGTETDTRLPAGAIDLVLMVDVYHELWHPQAVLRSVQEALKPSGRMILVEYRKEDRTIPIAETHRLSVADARAEIEPEGFTFERLIDGLPRQHIMVFAKRAGQVPPVPSAYNSSGDARRQ